MAPASSTGRRSSGGPNRSGSGRSASGRSASGGARSSGRAPAPRKKPAGRPPARSSGRKAAPAPKKKPTRKQRAAMRERKRMSAVQAKAGNRWRPYYDVEGPKVRLGVLWFLVLTFGISAGVPTATLVMMLACAAASAHTLRTWRAAGRDVEPMTALMGTALIVGGAVFGARAMGIALVLVTAAGIALAVQAQAGAGAGSKGSTPVEPGPVLARAGLWLQCVLPPSLAGGSMVLLTEIEPFAALALVTIVCAYDCGDFIVGSGSSNVVEGPLAGVAAVVVTTLAIASFELLPFETLGAIVFGSLVAVLAPAGQFLATAMLPHSRSLAPALRRVDSLLLAAPLWYFGLDKILL